MLAVTRVFDRISPPERWFFVSANKEMEADKDDREVLDHTAAGEKQPLAQDRGQNADVHRVANKAIEAAYDQMFCRAGGNKRAVAHDDEAHDRFQERSEARGDKQN